MQLITNIAQQSQQTVSSLSFSGIGVHTGKNHTIILHPGNPGQGFIFQIEDEILEANFRYVQNVSKRTALQKVTASGKTLNAATAEHLIGTLWLANIDNAVMRLSGDEVPTMDGSGKQFLAEIKNSVVPQDSVRKYTYVNKTVEIKGNGDSYIKLEPHDEKTIINYSIKFDHPMIDYQADTFIEGESNIEPFCNSRTFGFAADLEKFHSMGLALGASTDNVIGLTEDSILNEGGLRYPDEFVKHKILDCAGDIALLQNRLRCKIEAHNAGHVLHNQALRALFASEDNYSIDTLR